MTQEKILDKLKKLKAHSDSASAIGNEAEAQAFAAMLQKLLLQHKLDMTDIEYAAEKKLEGIIEQRAATIIRDGKRWYVDFPDVEITQKRKEWSERLAQIVASFYSCQILVTTGWSIVTFVGHRTNVQTCEYLFLTMMRSAEVLSEKAAKNFRKQWRDEHGKGATPSGYRESWLRGFSIRIGQRMKEERDKFGKVSGGSQCVALVRVNKEAQEVKQYIEETYTAKAKVNRGKKAGNIHGYADGTAVANKIDIHEGTTHKQIGD